ncbi:DNA-dependent RNA polymerase subunit epsilon [Dolosicoccus paucivorans]|uniref:DNA-directed RNA polymerase subunit epsilon n=1 Tax=Dolosicoccus paucivorans TaxID=84521 RepID=A0A1G8IY05_9LACT|nr:RNA polymerase epsilon subunit [Dolosicoccus paucivorans]PMB84669.1 DUF1447 domain-containing protein [Dolosicoccus paucivorans]PMC59227.1 DUF1447 domain-containing protein [Dolosicoccus paucivorans]SDI23617.1 DNA-dependent RNA polymerase auxiliary subunit epsilon [Dolosicoccus paucivorans]
MIFKVFYQPTKTEIPLRENTSSLFLEADSIIEAREKLASTPYNIEYIEEVSPAQLADEKENNPDFEIMEF